MILKNNIDYICFDLETTGLNLEKDEIIQIGIIKFNNNFKIIDKYSSYIKPNNFHKITNLSEIVEFTTGININKLNTAPLFKDIEPIVKKFFTEKSLIIGHNISFDINFLKKYIGNINYLDKFDTYNFSRIFLHYEPSYALEILADKYGFKRQSHDALEDSIMSMELFKLIIKKVDKLLQKYPSLNNIILNSNSIFKKILNLSSINQKLFSIPQKKTILQKNKKIISNKKSINTYPNKTTFNITNSNLKQCLTFALNNQNKVILSFSNYSRLNCCKNILKDMTIPFSYINTGFHISGKREKELLGKDFFEDYEIHYILKTFSHYNENISVFDLSSIEEKKIYNFLSDKRKSFTSNIVLSTHHELFNFIKENGKNKIKDFTVIFFDWHYGLNILGKVINQGFDFYTFLNQLDFLKYKLSYNKTKDSNIDDIINEVVTFFGLISIKIKPLFKGTNNKIEIINLIKKAENGLNQLEQPFLKLNKKLDKFFNENKKEIDLSNIKEYFNILQDCLNNYCIIEQKITFGNQLKYIFYPLKENIDINSLNDFMEGINYYCFTTLENKKYIKIGDNKQKKILTDLEKNLDFKKLIKIIEKDIQSNKSIYLISNNKNFSNSLFKLIYNLYKVNNIKGNIFAENITGGQGKILYYLKKDKTSKITIGGPEFLIQNKANNIQYDNYYILALNGKNKELIIKDINFYLQ